MHDRNLDAWQHDHDYLSDQHERNEHQTRLVIALTAAMMVVEIAAGTALNSQAIAARQAGAGHGERSRSQ